MTGDRPSQYMSSAIAKGRGDPKNILVGRALGRDDLDHVGLAACQRPGLVERQRAEPAEFLQVGSPFHQDPASRAVARPLTRATGVEITRAHGQAITRTTRLERTSSPLGRSEGTPLVISKTGGRS